MISEIITANKLEKDTILLCKIAFVHSVQENFVEMFFSQV